jgi:hypothetical protein
MVLLLKRSLELRNFVCVTLNVTKELLCPNSLSPLACSISYQNVNPAAGTGGVGVADDPSHIHPNTVALPRAH